MPDYIFEANPDNFTALVVENSRKGPVLANWWSPNAGPCLRLYPLLEKLCGEYAGRFLLVNVNAEEHKVLAREYGVTSLPLLMLFKGGESQQSVYGFQPEADLRRLLDRYTPRASDMLLAQAVRDFRQGDQDRALSRLMQIAIDDPANPRVPATTAKLLIGTGSLDEAQRVLQALPEAMRNEGDIATLLAHLLFLRLAAQAPGRKLLRHRLAADPNDLAARQQLAALDLVDDEYQDAMEQLLEIMRRDPRFGDGAGRQGLLAVFRILGNEHPLVERYRHRMQERLQ